MDRKREAELGMGDIRWMPVATKVTEDVPLVTVYERWCKGCGICVEFCPRKVLRLADRGKAEVVAPDRCTSCGLCEIMCPDFAITVPAKAHK